MDVVVPHAAWCPVGCQRAISVGPHQHVLAGAWHCWRCKTQLLKRVVLIGLKKTEHITHSCETGAVCVRAFSLTSHVTFQLSLQQNSVAQKSWPFCILMPKADWFIHWIINQTSDSFMNPSIRQARKNKAANGPVFKTHQGITERTG